MLVVNMYLLSFLLFYILFGSIMRFLISRLRFLDDDCSCIVETHPSIANDFSAFQKRCLRAEATRAPENSLNDRFLYHTTVFFILLNKTPFSILKLVNT